MKFGLCLHLDLYRQFERRHSQYRCSYPVSLTASYSAAYSTILTRISHRYFGRRRRVKAKPSRSWRWRITFLRASFQVKWDEREGRTPNPRLICPSLPTVPSPCPSVKFFFIFFLSRTRDSMRYCDGTCTSFTFLNFCLFQLFCGFRSFS